MSIVNTERVLVQGQGNTVGIDCGKALLISINKAKQGLHLVLRSVVDHGILISFSVFFLHIQSACHPYLGVTDIQIGDPDIRNPDIQDHDDDFSI